MKCKEDCIYYLEKLDTCMFCDYTPSDNLSDGVIRELILKQKCNCNEPVRCEGQEKEWDILKLDEEEDFCAEWSHKKLLKRLHNHGVDCYFCDMWRCDELAFIIGINSNVDKVAKVLEIHKECIYYDFEHQLMILNLFQEKYLRGLL